MYLFVYIMTYYIIAMSFIYKYRFDKKNTM